MKAITSTSPMNEERSREGLLVLTVKPTLIRFLTNNLYISVDDILWHFFIKYVSENKGGQVP